MHRVLVERFQDFSSDRLLADVILLLDVSGDKEIIYSAISTLVRDNIIFMECQVWFFNDMNHNRTKSRLLLIFVSGCSSRLRLSKVNCSQKFSCVVAFVADL